MNHPVSIRKTLQSFSNVEFLLDGKLEVSLDCYLCRRLRRTVVIATEEQTVTHIYEMPAPVAPLIVTHPTFSDGASRCTPTGHIFPSQFLDKKTSYLKPHSVEFELRFLYDFQPFTDSKYITNQPAHAIPKWARINFTTVCFLCGKKMGQSTQTNLVRPFTEQCSCSASLYVDFKDIEIEIIRTG